MAHGEVTWAAGVTLGFNLSNTAAWVLEAVAMMALPLLNNSNNNSSDKNHLLSRNFIPGLVLSAFPFNRCRSPM